MDNKKIYAALNELQGRLQEDLLAHVAGELELDPALRRYPDPELIQAIAAVQMVKDYLTTHS